jgi:hypothetical protein
VWPWWRPVYRWRGLGGPGWEFGVSASLSIPLPIGASINLGYEKGFGPHGGQETTFSLGVGTEDDLGVDASVYGSGSYTVAHQFDPGSGINNTVAGIITALNLANPVHWVAGPLGLYGPPIGS